LLVPYPLLFLSSIPRRCSRMAKLLRRPLVLLSGQLTDQPFQL
jgi:hypothetical protein